MASRSPENVQRNELIRYQLQDNIRAPANDFRISPSIDKVKHVFIYAQRDQWHDRKSLYL